MIWGSFPQIFPKMQKSQSSEFAFFRFFQIVLLSVKPRNISFAQRYTYRTLSDTAPNNSIDLLTNP